MEYVTEHYLNGDFYIDNSHNGKVHSNGIYTWKIWDLYDLNWKDDKIPWRVLMRKLILNFIFKLFNIWFNIFLTSWFISLYCLIQNSASNLDILNSYYFSNKITVCFYKSNYKLETKKHINLHIIFKFSKLLFFIKIFIPTEYCLM